MNTMVEENRPDPEALLHVIKLEEEKSKGGKLKIFFGMSARVGKTYTMLEDAQQRNAEGVDIVIGTVNTHGRKETDALTEGLAVIPEKSITYKGSVFKELDIDSILRRHPQIVLIDELAHTNVPGSRHLKRWQDVNELLEAGIDVYTTLNVQHMESRKDVVEEITGISIRETVPDSILEKASQIELVDITPTELLKRLKEGKVYIGTQSEIAARNFFQVDRLTALREIALRITAEKVDHDLHGLLPKEEARLWKTSERLMVAVDHTPNSQQLIRTARRYAFILDAPWIVLHVDTGNKLNEKENEQLVKNLELARELGAEIMNATDIDIGKALQRVAKQKNVTQIIIGRSQKSHFLKRLFGEKNLIDTMINENSNIDVHIIREDKAFPAKAPKFLNMDFTSRPSDYWWITFFIFTIGGICDLLSPSYISYQIVGFIFLLSIIGLSLFFNSGPILLSAVLFSLIWGFIFTAPSGAIFVGTSEIALFISFYVAALVLSLLNERIRSRERLLRRHEEKTLILYEIVREIATAPFSKELFASICNRLNMILAGESEILLKDVEKGLIFNNTSGLLNDEKEKAVAK